MADLKRLGRVEIADTFGGNVFWEHGAVVRPCEIVEDTKRPLEVDAVGFDATLREALELKIGFFGGLNGCASVEEKVKDDVDIGVSFGLFVVGKDGFKCAEIGVWLAVVVVEGQKDLVKVLELRVAEGGKAILRAAPSDLFGKDRCTAEVGLVVDVGEKHVEGFSALATADSKPVRKRTFVIRLCFDALNIVLEFFDGLYLHDRLVGLGRWGGFCGMPWMQGLGIRFGAAS